MEIDEARLDSAFRALSDPTRRGILARLAGGDATVTELMEPFSLSQPAISKHLKVLEAAGLVETAKDAQRRPRRLAPDALRDISEWVEDFHRQWRLRFERLDAHLSQLSSKEP